MGRIRVVEAEGNTGAELEREARLALIQALIPLGLEAVRIPAKSSTRSGRSRPPNPGMPSIWERGVERRRSGDQAA